MNHFCPGLIGLIRAKNAANPRSVRMRELNGATTAFQYTLYHMEKGCPLRGDAEAALAQARALAALLK